jgi:hypothetical protein
VTQEDHARAIQWIQWIAFRRAGTQKRGRNPPRGLRSVCWGSPSFADERARMSPGTVLIVDELINYKTYRDHEIKALWKWLAATGYHLRVIAGHAPDHPDSEGTVLTLNPNTDLGVCLTVRQY